MSNSLIVSLTSRAWQNTICAWRGSLICRFLDRTEQELANAGYNSRTAGLLAEEIPHRYLDSSRISGWFQRQAECLQQAAVKHLPDVAGASRFMAWGKLLRHISSRDAYGLLTLLGIAMMAGNLIYHLVYAFDTGLLAIDAALVLLLVFVYGADWQEAWAGSRLKAALDWLIDQPEDRPGPRAAKASSGQKSGKARKSRKSAQTGPAVPTANRSLAKYRWMVAFIGLVLGLGLSIIAGYTEYFPLYVVGAMGLIMALFRLEWGMVAMAAVLPLLPSKVMMLVCALVICAYLYRLLRGTATFAIDAIGIWLLVFGLALFISSLLSFSIYDSMQSMLAYGIYIAFYFVVSNVVKDRRVLFFFLLALLAGAGLESLYGIYQYNTGLETVGSNWVDIDEYPDLSTRVFGTMDNPNVLALYLELCLPVAFAWMWTARGVLRKSVFVLFLGVMGLCMIYTASRTGWVAMAGSIFLFGVLYDRRIVLAALLGFAGLMAYSPLIITSRIQNLGGSGDSSFMYRTFVWSLCWNMVKDFWYAGIGLGAANFEKIYSLYYMREGVIAHHSHNLYMQLIIETGIFGLTSFALLVYRGFARGLELIRTVLNSADAAMAAAVLSGLSGFLVHSLLEHSLYNYRIILAFFVMFTILSVLGRINQPEAAPPAEVQS